MDVEKLQSQLNDVNDKYKNIEEEVKKIGGSIENGKILLPQEEVYVVEAMWYTRTEYESYGYVRLIRQIEILKDEWVERIKDIKSREDNKEILEFFFDEFLSKYPNKLIIGRDVDIDLEEKNVYVEYENETYDYTGDTSDFLMEFCMSHEHRPYDAYVSFYKMPIKEYQNFKNINIEFSKYLTYN